MMFVDSKYRIHKGVNAQCVFWQAGLKLCQWTIRYFGLLVVKLAVLGGIFG